MNAEEGITLVSCQDDRPKQVELQIPRLAFDCIEYMAAVRIVHHLTERLQAVPFYKDGIREYLDYVFPASSKKGLRSATLAYEMRFLADRERSITARLTTHHLAGLLQQHLSNNYIRRASKIQPSRTVYPNDLGDRFQFDIFNELSEALRTELAELARTKALVTQRETAMAEYLRDIATAEATSSNLRLQKAIKLITIVATIAAVASLGTSILGLFHQTTTTPTTVTTQTQK